MCALDSLVEAAVEMLDSGISEEALPHFLAAVFDPDLVQDSDSLTWNLH